MKKIFAILAVIIATMSTASAYAQNAQPSDAKSAASKARAERIMQTRLQMLADELKFTEAQKVEFEPIYRKYRKEIQRVTTRDAHIKRESINNDNALIVLSARLNNQINTASVKQRYLHIFTKVIEPMQIMRLYSVDERISREARKVVKYNEKK